MTTTRRAPLVLLAACVFFAICTEMLPVGLLTPLAAGLGVAEGTAGLAVTLPGLAAALTAPPDQLQGNLQRLMYVHVPAAWLAFLSFGITFAASAGWLWKLTPRWDRAAAASAEAITIAPVAGPFTQALEAIHPSPKPGCRCAWLEPAKSAE